MKGETKKESVAIGLMNPKSPENVGNVLRAAGCYGADQIFYTGVRYENAKKFFTDTKNVSNRIPLTALNHLLENVSPGTKIVAVELVEGAVPLMDFEHPPHAYYIFGPEDNSLPQDILDRCDAVVYVPTIGCMNLAASVNVLLYDRLAKSKGSEVAERPICDNRDTNNKTRV